MALHMQIVSLLELCNPFVKKLDIKQLLPSDKGPPVIEEEDTERLGETAVYNLHYYTHHSLSELSSTQKPKDHLDVQYITKYMTNLEQLHLCYRWVTANLIG